MLSQSYEATVGNIKVKSWDGQWVEILEIRQGSPDHDLMAMRKDDFLRLMPILKHLEYEIKGQ